MKALYKISIFILMLGLGGMLASCGDPQVAPVSVFDGKANTTIAKLLTMHEITSTNSYIEIPDTSSIIITGIVTTSDEHGNCYKYINIEDQTGAIQIKIDNKALYNKFRVGQRVYVKCAGLVLGDYCKLPQLGFWENDGMQAIPSSKIYKYIFCDGLPQPVVKPTVLTTIPKADACAEQGLLNRLVQLDGASFVEAGRATYCEPNTATSHDIKMQDGTTITLRTSNYADFISETLPEGTGTITGILTRYNNTVQLVIRDLNDVQGFKAPQHSSTIFSVDYANAFNSGWTKETNGSEWKVLSNNTFKGFYINAQETTDSWLISPAIDLSKVSSPTLKFTHRAPQGGNNSSMKLMYTSNGKDWKDVPVEQFNTSELQFSWDIPEEAQTSKFAIKFGYQGNGSSWYISNINITAMVSK